MSSSVPEGNCPGTAAGSKERTHDRTSIAHASMPARESMGTAREASPVPGGKGAPVPSADGTSGIEHNLSSPNTARIYDCLLGSHDNFPADRELAGRLLEICPSLRGAARDNRALLGLAVTWATRQGIGRFADLGTGTSAHPSAGDAARAVILAARTAYIDIAESAQARLKSPARHASCC